MNDSVNLDTLLRSIKTLRAAGTHGPQSLSAMRTAGNEAILVMAEWILIRMMADRGSRPMEMQAAIERAQKKSKQELDGEGEERCPEKLEARPTRPDEGRSTPA